MNINDRGINSVKLCWTLNMYTVTSIYPCWLQLSMFEPKLNFSEFRQYLLLLHVGSYNLINIQTSSDQ